VLSVCSFINNGSCPALNRHHIALLATRLVKSRINQGSPRNKSWLLKVPRSECFRVALLFLPVPIGLPSRGGTSVCLFTQASPLFLRRDERKEKRETLFYVATLQHLDVQQIATRPDPPLWNALPVLAVVVVVVCVWR
jgi:hypothetical protein